MHRDCHFLNECFGLKGGSVGAFDIAECSNNEVKSIPTSLSRFVSGFIDDCCGFGLGGVGVGTGVTVSSSLLGISYVGEKMSNGLLLDSCGVGRGSVDTAGKLPSC